MTDANVAGFRLMTYNIHKGIGGVDRRYDLGRIVDVIRHYEPDVVFLQEVDEGVPRSNGHRQVEILADALELGHWMYQKNVSVKDGHYGNAILSRFPLFEPLDLELTVSIKKRRRALFATADISCGGTERSLLLCNAHLGLAGFERNIQINRIMTFERLIALLPENPVIVGGDFNDVWGLHGRKHLAPHGFHCAVGKTRTFPAAFPVRSLDAIYYRGGLELADSFAGRYALARVASDHLPVVAEFKFFL